MSHAEPLHALGGFEVVGVGNCTVLSALSHRRGHERDGEGCRGALAIPVMTCRADRPAGTLP
jgi:hypothetical protein